VLFPFVLIKNKVYFLVLGIGDDAIETCYIHITSKFFVHYFLKLIIRSVRFAYKSI